MVVLDASPIIYYSRIGELYWLVDFYRSLKTTGAIVRETVDDARELNKPGVSAIEMALSKSMINRLVDAGLRVKPQTLVAIYTVIESTKNTEF